MKKAVTVLSIIFCGVIVFFSLMGERLYYSTKPSVEIDRPVMINGALLVPESAVFGAADGPSIFTVESEQGFSTEILTVKKIPLIRCEPDEVGYLGEGYFSVEATGYQGGPIVIAASRALEDGERVVEE